MRKTVIVLLFVSSIVLATTALALYGLAQGGRLIAAAGGPAGLLPVSIVWWMVPGFLALAVAAVAVWLLWQESSSARLAGCVSLPCASDAYGQVEMWLQSEKDYLAQVGLVIGSGERVDAEERMALHARANGLQETALKAIVALDSATLTGAFHRWRIARGSLDECVREWSARQWQAQRGSAIMEPKVNDEVGEGFLSVFNRTIYAIEEVRASLADCQSQSAFTHPQ